MTHTFRFRKVFLESLISEPRLRLGRKAFTYNSTGVIMLFAKRLLYLAWQASRPEGFPPDRTIYSEDEVWRAAVVDDGKVTADRIFGRKINISFRFDETSVYCLYTGCYRVNQQSFAWKYVNFQALVDATVRSFISGVDS
jgi:hypothetical protein